MKRSKLTKIIPVIGVYSILAIVLYLVIQYKVEWEHKDLNTYLYFYDCNTNLCTSITMPKKYYSKLLCENNICPYITDIIGKNLILTKENKSWIYNYITKEIINNTYKDYKYINNDKYIITTKDNKQGIINKNNNIIIEPKYEQIINYTKNILLYKENNQYKINNKDIIYELDKSFTDVQIINDQLYTAKKDNNYYIYKYDNTNTPYTNNSYNYAYVYQDIILVINNKKIDIITSDLNSTLILKIDTLYDYQIEKERESLNISINNDLIYFDVFINENEYTTYKYNVLQKKLI